MDDMKRAMYIAAMNAVQKSEPSLGSYICWNLQDELSVLGLNIIGMYEDLDNDALVEQILEEFFPEFFQLFDYAFWTYNDRYIYNDDKHTAWFGYNDKKRRLAILDFIIANR